MVGSCGGKNRNPGARAGADGGLVLGMRVISHPGVADAVLQGCLQSRDVFSIVDGFVQSPAVLAGHFPLGCTVSAGLSHRERPPFVRASIVSW